MVYYFMAALSISSRKYADNWQNAKKCSKILRRMRCYQTHVPARARTEPGGNPSPDEFGFGRGNYQRVISSFFSSLLPFRLLLFIRSGQYLQVFKKRVNGRIQQNIRLVLSKKTIFASNNPNIMAIFAAYSIKS